MAIAAGRVSRIGRQRIRQGLARNAPIKHMDPMLIASALSLMAVGATMIYSSSAVRLRNQGFPERFLLDRQILFAIIGLAVAGVAASVPYRLLRSWSLAMYGVAVVLLIAVLTPLGSSALGAQRWISLGPLQLQPSEIMKIAAILILASVLAGARGETKLVDVGKATALVVLPALVIFKQPDLGTLLVLVAVLFGVLMVAGARLRVLLAMLLIGAVAFTGLLHVGLIKTYQVNRLKAFLDPSADPKVTGYNLKQSEIAVGSGGLSGTGLFNGTQTNLDFVPEQHTDFIFTAVGEETGFVGSAVLLALFAVFLWRGVRIAMLSKDLFGTLIAAGVVAMVTFQVFINVGMTIGISPITGIPLPFVSYGGSSLITNCVATGLLLNVHMRRF